MRKLLFVITLVLSSFTSAQQLELNFGEHPVEVLKNISIFSENMEVSNDIPEEITKMWDERDFGFELADGYYGYGPSAQYKVFDSKGALIGYMLAQTLTYSEDPEYHIAYTVCDIKGNTVIELAYDVFQVGEESLLPEELRPTETEE